MLDRRSGGLLVGAAAIGGYAFYGMLSPAEIEFTRPGVAAPVVTEMRAAVSTAHVTMSVDLNRVIRRADAALSQRLAMGLDVADPACSRKPQPPECAGARLDGAVAAGGQAEAAVSGNVVRIRLPLRLEAGLAGEKQSSQTAVSFAYRVQAGGGLPVEISRVDEPAGELQPGPAGRMIRLVETRLRPLGLTIQDELRAVLSELPVAMATERAWAALSQPIDLGTGAWLKAVPEVAGLADLAHVDGGFRLRVPIASRLSVEAGEPSSPAVRRGVVHGQVSTAGSAVVRAAAPIALADLQPALDAAFVKAGSIETRPDRFGPAVKVDVRRVRIYPSLRQVGVELDIAASRFEGQVYRGKAHLLGRPVLDAENRVVTLADVSLSPVPQRESASARQAGTAPRLANDPFAGKLAAAFRIDVARDTADAVPRANAMLQRRIDDRLALAARFSEASPAGFELNKDGGWLLVDLKGSLMLHFQGPAAAPAVAAAVERPAQTQAAGARSIATPEIAAAAVTSAAAIGAAQAVRQSSPGSSLSSAAGGGVPTLVPAAAGGDGGATADAAGQARPAAPRAQGAKAPVPKTANKSNTSKQASAGPKATWIPFATNN